jgi:hypothetical protein
MRHQRINSGLNVPKPSRKRAWSAVQTQLRSRCQPRSVGAPAVSLPFLPTRPNKSMNMCSVIGCSAVLMMDRCRRLPSELTGIQLAVVDTITAVEVGVLSGDIDCNGRCGWHVLRSGRCDCGSRGVFGILPNGHGYRVHVSSAHCCGRGCHPIACTEAQTVHGVSVVQFVRAGQA